MSKVTENEKVLIPEMVRLFLNLNEDNQVETYRFINCLNFIQSAKK